MWKYDIGRIALGGPARDELLAHEALSVNTPNGWPSKVVEI